MPQRCRIQSHVAVLENTTKRMTLATLICFLTLQFFYQLYTLGTNTEIPETQNRCQKNRLTEVFCSYSSFSSVPLDLDRTVKKLDLSYNAITNISWEATNSLRSLQELDISFNHLHLITGTAFENLAQLRVLSLAGNYLNDNVQTTAKAFQALRTLKVLDVSFNSLDSNTVGLYLQNLSSLEQLLLVGNSMTKLTHTVFKGTPHLKNINLENNNILEIEQGTFESLTRLTKLNMAMNNLACICDFALKQLKVLNLSRNSIEFFITNENEDVYQLEILDLSFNSLLYFPVLPKLNSLKFLDLQHNRLSFLKSETVSREASSLYKEITKSIIPENEQAYSIYLQSNLSLLIHLDMSHNQFTSFPFHILNNTASLEHLSLSNNCLFNFTVNIPKVSDQPGLGQKSIHQHVNFPSLHSLDLQHNRIQHLPVAFFEVLPQLEHLYLGKNNVNPCGIENKSGKKVPRHQDLTNVNNCSPFSSIKTLKYLDLHENDINMLFPYAFQHTPLVSLDLSGNEDLNIAEKALSGLEQTLQSLNISGNHMATAAVSLPCLGTLKKLDLSNNLLEDLPENIGCAPLKELDLRNNSLTTLDASAVTNLSASLQIIQVSGNVFNCCISGWLKILTKTKVMIPDLRDSVCSYKLNEDFSIPLLGDHSQECPYEAPTETGKTKLLILIFFVILFLTLAILVMAKRNCHRLGSSIDIKSNKVASFKFTKDDQCPARVAKINIFETAQ
ncbi:transforming growth factor beta activator LRRC32-like [Lepisosteus oculatus]|uniref:transforming growth factor beta activator LRRC32-like n=1 Tax=Lepisosteus oculatus TaxID=7918 RepID=UPI0037118535